MKPTLGMFILNLKILLSEKVVFIWSVIAPIIIFIVFTFRIELSDQSTSEIIQFLSYFWAFIIISTAFNGIGLHLSRMRNHGLLKTYTLIAGGKKPIVFAVIITQFVVSVVSLIIFTVFISIIFQLNTIMLTLTGLLLLLITFIPFALTSFVLTYLPVRDTSMSTFLNFGLFILLFLSLSEGIHIINILNYINPFVFVMNMSEILLASAKLSNTVNTFNYVNLLSVFLYMLFGIYCYKKLNLISDEYRS